MNTVEINGTPHIHQEIDQHVASYLRPLQVIPYSFWSPLELKNNAGTGQENYEGSLLYYY